MKVEGSFCRLAAEGQDKGTAARTLVKALGKKQALCLGDFLNDVPMFEAFPDTSVAMGNAHEGAMAAASMCTDKVDAEPTSG